MKKFDVLLTKIPRLERWVIEDKCTVILNLINRHKFQNGDYDFTTEEELRRALISYMKQEKILDLKEGLHRYHIYIKERIAKGELYDK